MAEYGYVMPVSEYKKQLAEANRDYRGRKTWENLYGSIDLAKQQQIGQLTRDYSEETAKAYVAAYKNNAVIMSSNLGQGYKAAAIEETDIALEEAYNAYRQNYLQGVSEVETAAAKANAGVTDALTEQAEYTKEFQNTPYEYLQYLWEKQQSGELLDAEGNKLNLFDEEMWKRYTYEVLDEEGKPTDERALKSWEQIVNYGAYDKYTDEFGNEQKEWTGLYDESGNLTIKGADFYDQMLNQLASEGRGISFGKWLNETNQELYDWSQAANPYDYTAAGTNLGSFQTLVGLDSDDKKYTFIERFGGFSRKEVDKMFEGFTNKVTELNAKVANSNGYGGKDIVKEYQSLTADVKKLTDRLGITAGLEAEMGMDFNELGNYLANLFSSTAGKGEIVKTGILAGLGVGSAATSSAVFAAKAGAAVAAKAAGLSSTLLGASTALGPVGWIAAAIAGIGIAVYTGISATKAMKEQNKELSKAARDTYNDLVIKLTTYAQQQRRQKQIDYYNKQF